MSRLLFYDASATLAISVECVRVYLKIHIFINLYTTLWLAHTTETRLMTPTCARVLVLHLDLRDTLPAYRRSQFRARQLSHSVTHTRHALGARTLMCARVLSYRTS